ACTNCFVRRRRRARDGAALCAATAAGLRSSAARRAASAGSDTFVRAFGGTRGGGLAPDRDRARPAPRSLERRRFERVIEIRAVAARRKRVHDERATTPALDPLAPHGPLLGRARLEFLPTCSAASPRPDGERSRPPAGLRYGGRKRAARGARPGL